MEHLSAREGVRKIYTAEIMVIIAVVVGILSIIPILGVIFSLGSAVLSIAAVFITLSGAKLAGQDEEGYNKAHLFLILVIVVAIASVICGFFSDTLSTILDTGSDVCEMIAVYYIITSTTILLKANGNNDLAEKGTKTWSLYCIAIILGGVASVLSLCLPIIVALLSIVAAILQIVAYFKYLSFLKAAYPIL